MKSRMLTPLTVLLCTLLLAVTTSKTIAQQQVQSASTTKENPNKKGKTDMESKRAKFDQHYNEVKQKEAAAKDPTEKADLGKILERMDAIRGDMKNYEANESKMSDQQKQQAHDNIKKQMDDVKQMEDAARTKYGKGGKNNGEQKQGVNNGTKQTSTDTQQQKDPQKMKQEGKKKSTDTQTNPK